MDKVLVDSSFLFALFNPKEKLHPMVDKIATSFAGRLVLPYVVLTEVAYLFNRVGGVPAVVSFLDKLNTTHFIYEPLTPQDFLRIRQIMSLYRDAKFDFVDCCLMALAERHHISIVCTLDQRDFAIFRPAHLDHLELLP